MPIDPSSEVGLTISGKEMSWEWSSLSAIRRREERRLDSVEREDLLGERLVLGEVHRVRSGPRVVEVEELQVGRDVHVLRVVAGVGLGQVEDEVRVELRERDERLLGAVEHLVERLVPELAQGLEDLLAVRLLALLLPALPADGFLRRRLGRRLLLFPDVVEDGDFQLRRSAHVRTARTFRASGSSSRGRSRRPTPRSGVPFRTSRPPAGRARRPWTRSPARAS